MIISAGKRPFIKMAFYLIPFLLFIIAMSMLFPSGPTMGFSSFIIAFEFASSPDFVVQLLAPLGAEEIAKVDYGNYVDMGFLVVYGSFLFFFFRIFKEYFNASWLRYGMALAVVAMFFDVLENLQLLAITDAYVLNKGIGGSLLGKLKIVTWIKWGSLAIAFLLFGKLFASQKSVYKFLAIPFTLPAILMAIASFSNLKPLWLDLFSGSIFIAFAVLLVLALTFKNKAYMS